MQAGKGVWHTGNLLGEQPVAGVQLWIALPLARELAEPQSIYLAPSQIPQEGPARVLLGSYGGARSLIPAPAPITYLAVNLKDGERWQYTPPKGQSVAWVAVISGQLRTNEVVNAGELALFEESEGMIEFVANGDTHFVLGSAVKHPDELVLGYYSVHTSDAALASGEAEIQRIGMVLRTRSAQPSM